MAGAVIAVTSLSIHLAVWGPLAALAGAFLAAALRLADDMPLPCPAFLRRLLPGRARARRRQARRYQGRHALPGMIAMLRKAAA